MNKHLYQIIKSYSNGKDEFVNRFYLNDDFLQLNSFTETVGYTGFEVMVRIIQDDIESTISDIKLRIIIFFFLFILIVLINHVVVWKHIVYTINMIQYDTNKIFGIMPIKFIIDYQKLFNYLKSQR